MTGGRNSVSDRRGRIEGIGIVLLQDISHRDARVLLFKALRTLLLLDCREHAPTGEGTPARSILKKLPRPGADGSGLQENDRTRGGYFRRINFFMLVYVPAWIL